MSDKYTVEVLWDETANLPTLIGPFDTEAEAQDFIRTSVPNGYPQVLRLAYPYNRETKD